MEKSLLLVARFSREKVLSEEPAPDKIVPKASRIVYYRRLRQQNRQEYVFLRLYVNSLSQKNPCPW